MLNILVTGANGFVGRNFCESLKNIRDGKDKTHSNLCIGEIFEYDVDTDISLLDVYCQKTNFVFNFAGVNRPQNSEEFIQGNVSFFQTLLEMLKKYHNTCPVVLSSSVQATCIGRYDSEYGRSKKEGEELAFSYQKETGSSVLVYRFPNLFGKWCRPNYNSVVATFCYNVAHGFPITVHDRNVSLELLYIDDLIDGMLAALEGKVQHCRFEGTQPVLCQEGEYCVVSKTHCVTLGEIADLLGYFQEKESALIVPEMPDESFSKKLYSTYLSYLPKEKICIPLNMKEDSRGSFTECLKTEKCGQLSVNISKPGVTKGQHWHHTKWEFFIVVSGKGLIQQRKIGTEEILNFEVSGNQLQAVRMLPGYTHNLVNLSKTEDLITVMWANESFDPNHPDTFFEVVE